MGTQRSMGMTINYAGGPDTRPPVPYPAFDGTFTRGKSYKFNSDLPIVDAMNQVGLKE